MIGDSRPFLLLRSRVRPEARPRFAEWFREVHLRDVTRIPGIAGVQGATTAAGTKLGFYSFESAEVVQSALSSPEAAYTRGTWEPWSPELEELSIELFAALFPLPIYQSGS